MTFEIVKEIGKYQTAGITRESHLVRLGAPILCRQNKTFDLYETDYVIVEALRIVEDGDVYEETHVVASDDEGVIHDSVLYQATRALTVPEALFSIGEHNYDPSIEPVETPAEPDNTDETEAV